MSVLMLDFDGVLNSRAYLYQRGVRLRCESDSATSDIDPKAVSRLNEIVERTGCDVVISSSWRYGNTTPELEGMLRQRGYRHTVLDSTPRSFDEIRGHEIQAWLNDNGNPSPICILDDCADMAHLMPFLVKTDMATGLQDEHVERAAAMLNKEKTNAVSR